MKIAITASGRGLADRFETRFGRAEYFIIYDLDSNLWEGHANSQNYQAAQGAGIQAAETIRRLGVSALVTGHVGPKAFKVLAANNIKVFTADAQTVQEAVATYKKGLLAPMEAADVQGHWA